ncbi:flagellar assembly protein FliW [Paenibacillus sp. NPDC057967]|uniref:flagellar assembly protein FliW n=1 Tax=Paenibacillus sp. NPDC057967 TaxID=3346293 RepID=UPI0036D7675E
MEKQWIGGIIDFNGSIYGFEDYRYFRVEAMNEESHFSLLSSMDDSNIGFLVTSPFDFNKSYEFKLSEEIIETLKVERPDDIVVMVIATVKQPFESSTVNLLAPLVVNMKNGIGRQIVLPSDQYSVHTPVFPTRNEGDE